MAAFSIIIVKQVVHGLNAYRKVWVFPPVPFIPRGRVFEPGIGVVFRKKVFFSVEESKRSNFGGKSRTE